VSFRAVRTFYTSSSRGLNGPDAPPLAPAMRSLPLRSASAPGGWRATRGCGCGVVASASGRGRRALCGAAPPASSPLTRPDPSGPSAHPSIGSDHHRGKRVTSGGAGRTRSKRLDPGAPTTPRPAIAGRPGPAGGDARLPLPRSSDDQVNNRLLSALLTTTHSYSSFWSNWLTADVDGFAQ
jgi:hypothetical protein